MAARKLSVRERVVRAIVAQYLTIKPPTYATTVNAVRRYRVIPELVENAPEILPVFDDAEYQYRSDTMLWIKVPMHCFFVLDTENRENVDTEFNLFLADIERASVIADPVGRTGFRVASGGTPNYRDVWAEAQGNRGYYSDATPGQCVGRITFELTWSQLIKDPALFDDQDVAVTA